MAGLDVTAVIDWINTCAGDPRADVARTLTLLLLAPVYRGWQRVLVSPIRRLLASGWLRGIRQSPAPLLTWLPYMPGPAMCFDTISRQRSDGLALLCQKRICGRLTCGSIPGGGASRPSGAWQPWTETPTKCPDPAADCRRRRRPKAARKGAPRGRPCHAIWYVILPPTIVMSTLISFSSAGSQAKGFRSRTTRSAAIPGASVPLTPSWNVA